MRENNKEVVKVEGGNCSRSGLELNGKPLDFRSIMNEVELLVQIMILGLELIWSRLCVLMFNCTVAVWVPLLCCLLLLRRWLSREDEGEGRFEILSLSGSFMSTDNGIVKSRSGGMSVSLAGPDGRVLGGGLASLLVAASPVQVVLRSFLPGHHQEHKPKKQRVEPVNNVMPAVIHQNPEGGFGGQQKLNFASPPPSFHSDNLPSMNSTQHDPLDLEADNNASTPERDFDEFDEDDSPSNLEISG